MLVGRLGFSCQSRGGRRRQVISCGPFCWLPAWIRQLVLSWFLSQFPHDSWDQGGPRTDELPRWTPPYPISAGLPWELRSFLMVASAAAVGGRRTPRETPAPRNTVRWNGKRPPLHHDSRGRLRGPRWADGQPQSSQMEPPPPVIFAVGEETGCKAFLSPLFLPTPSGIWSLFRFGLFLPAVGTGRAWRRPPLHGGLYMLRCATRRLSACCRRKRHPPAFSSARGGYWGGETVLLFCSVVYVDADVAFPTLSSWVVMAIRFASHSLHLHFDTCSYFLIVSSLFAPSISVRC
jgi:hypothetical protein